MMLSTVNWGNFGQPG